ncbi:MAG TPA: ATP-binding protein [Candidatus Eisenbacteria bacterium]|nr:ATP-binding protein [Candidatus Eisenbacteria bacterium]
MRKTVIASSAPDHSVQFYEDDAFLCQEVGRFLGIGLDRGEAILVIAGERHRRGVAACLDASGYALGEARESGQLLELDAEETLDRFMSGSLRYGMPDPDSFERVVGGLVEKLNGHGRFTGLRAFGEMVDFLTARGNAPATLKLEELWNGLRRAHTFRLFCGYSMANFRKAEDTEAFRRICSLHEHVLPTEGYDDRWTKAEQRLGITELQQRSGALEAEIAERKKLEQALRDEQRRLREANERKDEFIALLSHELRNPLAPILTSLDLMDVRGDVSSRREREIIRRQARHLATLVEDLLDVSRVASGKISLQKQVMEFAAIADAALEMAGRLFQDRCQVLELEVPSKGLLLEADPVRLPQVVANLLANASKFTPARGRVSLRAVRDRAEIVVTVDDDGIGIAPEKLDEIFSPFKQARQGIDRSDGGLGLGLTLVRSLTELHGGTAAAFSEGSGKGSRFTLRLPAARSDPSSRGRVRRRETGGEAGDAAGRSHLPANGSGEGRRRVLVVDDNHDAASSLAALLEQFGFRVRTAHGAEEAMIVAASFAPDAAIVDIGLPDIDGYELATRLRGMRDGARLLLVALTGYGQATDRAKSVLAGFDTHLVKPVGAEVLRAVLEGAVLGDSSLR